uniref:Fatty acid binding protein 5 n=1 Tax=Felis catus TaxID=9685 RepID=A0ABI7W9S6_FELCA
MYGKKDTFSKIRRVRNIREQGIKCVAQSHKTMTMPFFVSRETRAGVGMALRKVGAMAKPDCIISSDGKNLTIKTESTLKTTQFSCNLGEKFEETTADGRKTQTVCTFTNGALVQHQEWDGKESTITRKLEDGKLVVVSADLLISTHSSLNCSISLIMNMRTLDFANQGFSLPYTHHKQNNGF